jgi:hypothetical protein
MSDAMRDRVYAVVAEAGEVDETLFQLLYPPCTEALLRHLKPETDPETDCPEAFILAAGWLILDRMEVQTEAAVPLSFTAGSVTISGTDSGRRTRAAFDLLSPWCRDDRFAVREVMG